MMTKTHSCNVRGEPHRGALLWSQAGEYAPEVDFQGNVRRRGGLESFILLFGSALEVPMTPVPRRIDEAISACSRFRLRLEGDLGVVREEVAPQEPVMPPRNLTVRRIEAVLLHELRQVDRSFARHVGRARAQPVELDAAALHG